MLAPSISGFDPFRSFGDRLPAFAPASTLLAMVTYLRPASWAKSIASRRGRSWRTFANLTSGKIHSCEHVHFWTAHAGNSQVGRRAAEHVDENDNAVTAIDPIHRFND